MDSLTMEQILALAEFDKARVVLIPVPWEVTASGGSGTARSAEDIRKASFQMDFFQKPPAKTVRRLIFLEKENETLLRLNRSYRRTARKIIERLNRDLPLSNRQKESVGAVNQACRQMTDWLYNRAGELFSQGKIPAVAGGDHSVSEGLIRRTAEKYSGDFGLLHIDAHCDLRERYQGFDHSHASVMFNVMNHSPAPAKLLQVGVRDFCQEEYDRIQNDKRIVCYFDEDLSARLFQGEGWGAICKEIIARLPSRIHVSLDMDGLEWPCAPGTGTPVPGGLTFNQTLFLLDEIAKQGKELVSFDVVEISPGGSREAEKAFGHWNGAVAGRLIYRLCRLALQTAGTFDTHSPSS